MEPDSNSTGRSVESNGLDQASLSELMQQLSGQVSISARKEVELAKAEVADKGKRLGVGLGAFGVAGIVGLFSLGALTAALILAVDTGMEGWLAASIVGVVYALVTGGLALAGRQKVEAASPPVPERAIESTKLDIDAAKAGAKEGRNG